MSEFVKIIKKASNVYRTKYFIVAQIITFEVGSQGDTRLFSNDIYFPRTKQLDKDFESEFDARKFLDGKRIHTTVYVRHYA